MSKSAAEAVQVIQPGKTYIGKQGFSYGAGASTETVGARQVCMNVLPMPPGAKAKDRERLEHFPFAVNRRDSHWAANKILWSSQAEETGKWGIRTIYEFE